MEDEFYYSDLDSLYFVGISYLVLFYLLVTYIQGKRTEKIILEKESHEKIMSEKIRISTEMHDDIGADLSNILFKLKIYQNINGNKNLQEYFEIEQFTKEIIKKVNETIWSLNTEKDTLKALGNFMLKYIDEHLIGKNINYNFKDISIQISLILNIEMRRNIFNQFKAIIEYILLSTSLKNIEVVLNNSKEILEIYFIFDGIIENSEKNRLSYRNIQKNIMSIGGQISEQKFAKNGNKLIFQLHLI